MSQHMTEATLREAGAGRYSVSGPLTFATVRDVLRAGQSTIVADGDIEIDLSNVAAADSAGLALLIEWYRVARRRQQVIRFKGTPESLQALAKISELDKVLTLQ